MQQQTLNGKWQFRQLGSEDWLPAVVPGGVHTDLIANKRIPDPFVGDNELRVQWVAESDWEYRRSFHVDPSLLGEAYVFLVCDGLDTLAEVSLNGQLLGQAENMFRQYRWPVKEHLRGSENELTIRFAGPVKVAKEKDAIRHLGGGGEIIPGGQYLRKAPCHFGWDWGPKLPPIGIWREIRLEGCTTARLEDVAILQHHNKDQVNLTVAITPEVWEDIQLRAVVRVISPDGQGKIVSYSPPRATLPSGNLGGISISIEDPQLWWPNGYGPQPLYQVDVSLFHDKTLLDNRSFSIGLRTLELRQDPDEWGYSFTFVVNGVPIFAKGANWIPSDSFPTRITASQLEHLIRSSTQANYNMLRAWGGGYYEDNAFFDLCDRYGILIWQDFMFACAPYPLNDPSYLENVHQEVIQNVRRLRHHPSLALWCGNNEIESGWVHWGWSTPGFKDLKNADQHFFYKLLPDWIASQDPDRPYWPSSPSSHTPHENPNSNATGDNHLWEVWHSVKPIRFYREQYPRFASEFGMQSLPTLATIATFAEPSDWNMTSYTMEHHQRHSGGNSKIISYTLEQFRLPKNFDALVYLTQVLQAEAMRTAVDHWRRQRARCSGTLYWQINDCWPVNSWSSIDYFGRWKALHYYARRFYAPLLLSVEDSESCMKMVVNNDGLTPWDGEVRWRLENLHGDRLVEGSEKIHTLPSTATQLTLLDFSENLTLENRRSLVFVSELWQNADLRSCVVTPFVPDKHLELENPRITWDAVLEGKGGDGEEKLVTITLQSSSLARFVELNLGAADVVFSDNFFDLPPNHKVSVSCPLPEGWTIKKLRTALRVRSLYDSYS